MPLNPSTDLATHLATALSRTLGTNIFHGPVREADGGAIPSEAIFVMPNGGPSPDAHNGEVNVIRRSDVLVRVRSAPRGYASGVALAISTMSAIHYASIAGYISVRTLDSQPIMIGQTEHGESEFSLTARMIYQENE
jgi:hypothetical protein